MRNTVAVHTRSPSKTPRLRALLVGISASLCVAAVVGCSYSREPLSVDVPKTAESSRIYATDGRLITVVHGGENRDVVSLDVISDDLQNAIVAIEDERFWQHSGVDFKAIVRAARQNAAAGDIVEGGSTLEQQLVKNLIVGDAQDLDRKLEEFTLARKLDENYSKEWILESYLNTIYFCHNAWGIQAAAEEYFDKDASDLSLGEAALLAGMVQRPCDLDPVDNVDAGLERRELVLRAMRANGYITAADAASAAREELVLAPVTPVVDEEYVAPHFIDEVRAWFFDNETFGATRQERRDLFYEGGLEIHTTVDLDLQFGALFHVANVLGGDNETPRGALVSIEPGTGRVRAMVGGIDYFREGEFSKVNLAMGRGRQAGSAFKPLVLAAALDSGLPLRTRFPNPGSTTLLPDPEAPPWKVSNYSRRGTAPLDLTEATVASSNTVYAQLILDVGIENANAMAAKLGITSSLQEVPASVLGANDVTVLDMANAYATFGAEGIRSEPVMVERVLAPDGSELYRAPVASERVLDSVVANRVSSVLEQVVERGTGTAAQIPDRPVAGKTGTTTGWADAWFVGYTPQLATAVWVGFPRGQISMTPPATPLRVTGGSWPAEIWQGFSAYALAEQPVLAFPEPPAEPFPKRTTNTTLPDVTGATTSAAVRTLSDLGLNVSISEVPNGGRPRGIVVGILPAAGSTVSPGEPVTISVTGDISGPIATPRPPADAGVAQPPGPERSPNTPVADPGATDTPAPADPVVAAPSPPAVAPPPDAAVATPPPLPSPEERGAGSGPAVDQAGA